MLLERLDSIQADQRRLGEIISQRTRITIQEAEELFLEAKTRDPHFALDKGIIQEIRDVKIPEGSPLHQFVFQR